MNADRQLVSIFFADIAGYTAMMQADEGKAISRVGRFREILESEVTKNGGRVVQNYGDGALCIFNSVLGSVKAAESVQLLLQQAPEVPVRIGIHLGDVIFRDGDVYGDAVNVTSRIESMGVPGSVLISSDTFQKIKNRAELEFISLGSYNFKNVAEPMEVRALKSPGLQIPDKRKVQGKFAETSKTAGWWKWAVAAVILLALGFGISQVTTGPQGNTVMAGFTGAEDLPSIAVLPFRNLSEAGESTFLAEGIMEDLLNKLSKLNQINVISRTSSMSFKNSEKTIPEIAEELGADYYVEGSVQKSGDRVRFSVNLISRETDNPLWSHSSEEHIEDIFEVQGKISLEIAKLLVATIRPETETTILAVPTKDFDAWESYVKSLDLVASRRPDQMKEAIGLLNNAINMDPDFSEAYGVLAEAYLMTGYYGERDVNYAKAKSTAEAGIKVNPSIGRSYAILGNLHQYKGEWDEAEIDFEKAIEFSPNDGTVNKWYSLVFTNTNQNKKALSYTRKAKEVDPLNPSSHLFQVQVLLVGNRTDEARSLISQIEKDFPEDWQSGWMMARSYLTDGLYEEALTYYLKNPLKDTPFLKSEMAFCYGKLGEKEKAWALFDDIDPEDAKYHVYAAHVYAGLGEVDQAFNSLSVIGESNLYDLVVFLIKPEGIALKQDPRYWQLMDELGLKEYWEEEAELAIAE